jgi:Short C-terminal domain
MFIGRRRPLLRAAMVGGAGYMVGKRRAQSQEAEQQQAPQAAPAPAAPAAGGSDLVGQLKQLTDMKSSGALSDAEFEAAKAKLLGGS